MKSLHILASALITAPAVFAPAAHACHPLNPVCNKPHPIIRKPIKKTKKVIRKSVEAIEDGWVKGRDSVLAPVKGHICKQYLLNVRRGAIGGLSAMSRFPVASRWLINSGQVTAAELNNTKIYYSGRIINAPALTFAGDIYINDINMGSYQRGSMQTALMIAHEMEHVRQFRRFGSTEKFCAEYESQVASHGNHVDFHRLGGFEVAAGQAEYRFARWVIDRTKLIQISKRYGVGLGQYQMTIAHGRERIARLPVSLPTEEQYARFVNAGYTTAMPNVPVPEDLRPNTDPRLTDPGFTRPNIYNTDPQGWGHSAQEPTPPRTSNDLGGAINGLIDALRNR